jgi:integral membrane sensor domain MASE1
LLVAVAYVVAARFGFAFAFATKQVTAVWPPTGIAIVALLLYGYRIWPGIWVGALLSNAFAGEPFVTAAAIATGNTAAPLLGNVLLQRFEFQNSLERVRDVLVLTLFGSAIAMTVSATNGVVQLALARIIPWSAFPSVWWVWWAGDAMGVLLVAPLLLTWLSGDTRPTRSEGGTFELAAVGTTILATSGLSFLTNVPLRFSVYPFIVWVALRFRQRETAAAIAFIAGIAIWATAHDLGPWTSGSLDLRLVQLDSWMSVLAFTGLVLGAVTAEKRAARFALNAALKQTQHSVDTLQAAFLPSKLPQRSGLRCDALYIPAEREALIGGDWYDAFELPDGRIVFSIGDVAGHGLDAAVTGSRVRRSIFATAFASGDPGKIISNVEETLRSELDTLVTAIVAVLSKDLSQLSYSSAGHPPPILAAPNIPAHVLERGELPFGMGLPLEGFTRTIALEPGAVILFYTDGLTEFQRNVDLGESAALQAVSQLVVEPDVEHPAAFVQRRVMGTQRPTDDTVLLVAQIAAPEANRGRRDSNPQPTSS